MWNSFMGKSDDRTYEPSSKKSSSRRKDDDDGKSSSSRHRSDSQPSSSSARKSQSSRGDDRDRGFNPTSTAFSSTSRSGNAAPSVASSYATAISGDLADEFYKAQLPDLVRNESMADRVPRTKDKERGSSYSEGRRERKKDRRERSRSRSLDADDRKREKRDRGEKSERREKRRTKSGDGYLENVRASDIGIPSSQNGGTSRRSTTDPPSSNSPAKFSSHVPDQFPGQYSNQTARPFLPVGASSEGGVGLAAEYYGDQGESVQTQPGVRPAPPSLIVGAEPHLQAASATSNPPPEPSSLGQTGAAASFFAEPESFSHSPSPAPSSKPSKHSKHSKSSKSSKSGRARSPSDPAAMAGALGNSSQIQGQSQGRPVSSQTVGENASYYNPNFAQDVPMIDRPQNGQSSQSKPMIPAVGGAAAGYFMAQNSSSQLQHSQSATGSTTQYFDAQSQRPPSQADSSYDYTRIQDRPSQPGKRPSSSNAGLYAAGAAGAAGLAAAAMHNHNEHSHQTFSQNSFTIGPSSQFQTPHRHRHRGPLGGFVEFFKDPYGVAQFEKYSEITGVCRYCFEPGSSPRDAPRTHHYRRRGSNERLGSSTRVDKTNRRYVSSDDERRGNKSSWLATGLAGYGLAKIGPSIFNSNNKGFDDTYSVKSGRYNGSTSRISMHSNESSNSISKRSYTSRGVTRKSSHRSRSRSRDRTESGMTADGKYYRKDSHGRIVTYDRKRHESRSRSRSGSRRRHSGLAEAAIGAAVGGAVASTISKSGRRSQSPKKRRHRRDSSASDSARRRRSTRRHSPNTSFVDISRSQGQSGGTGYGTFFSAPSERRHKSHSKKKKGFFTWGNSSSSSSDADMAFGSGFSRRSTRRRDTKQKDPHNAELAMLRLGVAGLTAHEVYKDRKGSKAEIVAVKETRDKRRRKHHKSKHSSSSSDQDDGAWEDDSGDESSSINSGLAYGGYASRSRESVASDASGTNKWVWRWGSKTQKKKKPDPEGPAVGSFTVPAAARLAGAAIGSAMAPDARRQGPADSVTSLQSMQQVFPTPTNDPNQFDVVTRQSSMVSPASTVPPLMTSRPAPIPLQQPQPMAPVSQSVYTTQGPPIPSYSAPTGPPVFSHPPGQPSIDRFAQQPLIVDPGHPNFKDAFTGAAIGAGIGAIAAEVATSRDSRNESSRRRRDSSPSYPSNGQNTGPKRRASTKEQSSSVSFDLTREQEDKAKRERYRKDRQQDENRHQEEARKAQELEDIERRERQRRERDDERRQEEAERREAEQEAEIEREKRRAVRERKDSKSVASSRSTDDIEKDIGRLRHEEDDLEEGREHEMPTAPKSKREEEIDAELERLYEEEKRAAEQQRSATSCVKPAAVVGVGAVVGAAFVAEASKTPHYDVWPEQQDRTDGQTRIAQKAASKIQRTPSPVYDHDDYANFFTPPELLEHARTHNYDSTHPDGPEIVEIVPSDLRAREPNWDSSYYQSMEGEDDRDKNLLNLPWKVPNLNLIEPTPPASRAPSSIGNRSPAIAPDRSEDDEVEEPRKTSKVSWGEHSTHEYDVITPMSEHNEFIRDHDKEGTPSPESIKKSSPLGEEQTRDSPDVAVHDPEIIEITPSPPKDKPRTPSLPLSREPEVPPPHMPGGFDDDIDFAATLAAGTQAAGFDSSIVIDDPTYRRRDSPPGSEAKGFYRSSFVENVSDLGIGFDSPGTEGAPPRRGFVEGEIQETPKDEKTREAYIAGNEPKMPKIPNGKPELSQDPMAANFTQARDVPLPTVDKSGSYSEEPETIPRAAEGKPNVFDDLDESKSPKEVSNGQSKTAEAGYFDATDVVDDDLETPRKPTSDLSDTKRKSKKKSNRDSDTFDDAKSPPDEFDDSLRSKRRSKRSSESLDDSRSLPSDFDDSKSSRRRSKRENGGLDDDGSVVSSPAKFDDLKSTKKDRKDKKGGMFSSIFGSAKPDDTVLDERHSKKSPIDSIPDDFEEPRKKSKRKSTKDRNLVGSGYDLRGSAAQSVSDLSQIGKPADDEDDQYSSRKGREEKRRKGYEDIVEPARSSQNKPRERSNSVKSANSEDQSFLEERPEMPHTPDGASGSFFPPQAAEAAVPFALSSMGTPGSSQGSLPADFRRHSMSPPSTEVGVDLAQRNLSRSVSPSPRERMQQRRLSELRTVDTPLGSGSFSSPTAVPLAGIFRRQPLSPGIARNVSVSSPVVDSPLSPSSATPKTRQARPTSTELRPLWLVERHSTAKLEEPEEAYPSLPSSRTSSRAPSIQDDSAVEQQNVYAWETPSRPESSRRLPPGLQISSDTYFDEHDLLDSQTTTPTATSFPPLKKEKPKYEFHSPSELLEDPSQHVMSYDVFTESPQLEPVTFTRDEKVQSPEMQWEVPAKVEQPYALEDLPALPESRPSSRGSALEHQDSSLAWTAAGLGAATAAALTAASMKREYLDADGEKDMHDLVPSPPDLAPVTFQDEHQTDNENVGTIHDDHSCDIGAAEADSMIPRHNRPEAPLPEHGLAVAPVTFHDEHVPQSEHLGPINDGHTRDVSAIEADLMIPKHDGHGASVSEARPDDRPAHLGKDIMRQFENPDDTFHGTQDTSIPTATRDSEDCAAQSREPPAEYGFPPITLSKKPKKDKKSKRKSRQEVLADEPDASTESVSVATESAEPTRESSPIRERDIAVVSQEPVVLPSIEDPLATSQEVEEGSKQIPESQEPAEADEWSAPSTSKKFKKDKKGKKKGKTLFSFQDEPASSRNPDDDPPIATEPEAMHESSVLESAAKVDLLDAVPVPAGVTSEEQKIIPPTVSSTETTEIAPGTQVEDKWQVSVTKSKKAKKGRKRGKHDPFDAEGEHAGEASPGIVESELPVALLVESREEAPVPESELPVALPVESREEAPISESELPVALPVESREAPVPESELPVALPVESREEAPISESELPVALPVESREEAPIPKSELPVALPVESREEAPVSEFEEDKPRVTPVFAEESTPRNITAEDCSGKHHEESLKDDFHLEPATTVQGLSEGTDPLSSQAVPRIHEEPAPPITSSHDLVSEAPIPSQLTNTQGELIEKPEAAVEERQFQFPVEDVSAETIPLPFDNDDDLVEIIPLSFDDDDLAETIPLPFDNDDDLVEEVFRETRVEDTSVLAEAFQHAREARGVPETESTLDGLSGHVRIDKAHESHAASDSWQDDPLQLSETSQPRALDSVQPTEAWSTHRVPETLDTTLHEHTVPTPRAYKALEPPSQLEDSASRDLVDDLALEPEPQPVARKEWAPPSTKKIKKGKKKDQLASSLDDSPSWLESPPILPSIDIDTREVAEPSVQADEAFEPKPEDTARDLNERSEASSQPEEVAWAPISKKRGKKDKKRQKSLLVDDSGSTSREDPSILSRDELEPGPVVEPVRTTQELHTLPEPAISSLPVLPEPANEAAPEESQELWEPTMKKSQKGKKKRKPLAWTAEPEVEEPRTNSQEVVNSDGFDLPSTQPSSEPIHPTHIEEASTSFYDVVEPEIVPSPAFKPVEERALIEDPETMIFNEPSTGTTKEIQEVPPSEPAAEHALTDSHETMTIDQPTVKAPPPADQEEHSLFTPMKKGKKDKKKRKSSTWTDDLPTPDVEEPAIPRDVAETAEYLISTVHPSEEPPLSEEPIAMDLERPTAIDPEESIARDFEPPTASRDLDVQELPSAEPEDERASTSKKKGKKDKKKRKSTPSILDGPTIEPVKEIAAPKPTITETPKEDIAPKTSCSVEPELMDIELAAAIVPTEELRDIPVEEPEDTWKFTPKKGKKGKNSRGLDDSGSGTATPTSLPATDIPEITNTIENTSNVQPFGRKLSKKEKRGKNKVIAWGEPDESVAETTYGETAKENPVTETSIASAVLSESLPVTSREEIDQASESFTVPSASQLPPEREHFPNQEDHLEGSHERSIQDETERALSPSLSEQPITFREPSEPGYTAPVIPIAENYTSRYVGPFSTDPIYEHSEHFDQETSFEEARDRSDYFEPSNLQLPDDSPEDFPKKVPFEGAKDQSDYSEISNMHLPADSPEDFPQEETPFKNAKDQSDYLEPSNLRLPTDSPEDFPQETPFEGAKDKSDYFESSNLPLPSDSAQDFPTPTSYSEEESRHQNRDLDVKHGSGHFPHELMHDEPSSLYFQIPEETPVAIFSTTDAFSTRSIEPFHDTEIISPVRTDIQDQLPPVHFDEPHPQSRGVDDIISHPQLAAESKHMPEHICNFEDTPPDTNFPEIMPTSIARPEPSQPSQPEDTIDGFFKPTKRRKSKKDKNRAKEQSFEQDKDQLPVSDVSHYLMEEHEDVPAHISLPEQAEVADFASDESFNPFGSVSREAEMEDPKPEPKEPTWDVPVSRKKGKKDRRAKEQQFEEEVEQPRTTVEDPVVQPHDTVIPEQLVQEQERDESAAAPMEEAITIEDIPKAFEQGQTKTKEDEWGFPVTRKKSKKGKKKGMTLEEPEPSFDNGSGSTSRGEVQTFEPVETTREVIPEEPPILPEQTVEELNLALEGRKQLEEELASPAVGGKQSKKKKKGKKGQDDIWDGRAPETETSTSTPAEVATVDEPMPSITLEPENQPIQEHIAAKELEPPLVNTTQAPKEIETDEFWSPTPDKKGKRGKKGKKSQASWGFPEEDSVPATSRSSQPDLSKGYKPSPFEREIESERQRPPGGFFEELHDRSLASEPLPSKETSHGAGLERQQAEGGFFDESHDRSFASEPRPLEETPHEAETDAAWDVQPKKGKKGKKGKRQSLRFEDVSEPATIEERSMTGMEREEELYPPQERFDDGSFELQYQPDLVDEPGLVKESVTPIEDLPGDSWEVRKMPKKGKGKRAVKALDVASFEDKSESLEKEKQLPEQVEDIEDPYRSSEPSIHPHSRVDSTDKLHDMSRTLRPDLAVTSNSISDSEIHHIDPPDFPREDGMPSTYPQNRRVSLESPPKSPIGFDFLGLPSKNLTPIKNAEEPYEVSHASKAEHPPVEPHDISREVEGPYEASHASEATRRSLDSHDDFGEPEDPASKAKRAYPEYEGREYSPTRSPTANYSPERHRDVGNLAAGAVAAAGAGELAFAALHHGRVHNDELRAQSPGPKQSGRNRDSGVHVTDRDRGPGQHSARDSGYVPSPVVHSDRDSSTEPIRQTTSTERRARPISPTSSHEDASETKEMPEHLQDSRASLPSQMETSTTNSSAAPLNISVEMDPAYEVSVSRPVDGRPRNRSIEIHWEGDEIPGEEAAHSRSLDASETQITPTKGTRGPRQPSPVDSTTKDRSSALFNSSPSTRPDGLDSTPKQLKVQTTDIHRSPTMHGKRSHSSDLHRSPSIHSRRDHSPLRDIHRSPSIHGRRERSPHGFGVEGLESSHLEPEHYRSLSSSHDLGASPERGRTSLFGGPTEVGGDHVQMVSPPRTPLGSRLDTIREHVPVESPPQSRKRDLSDVGSPDRNIQYARRSGTLKSTSHEHMHSAGVMPPVALTPGGIADQAIGRLSWPDVDEHQHTVDIDRVKSRGSARSQGGGHDSPSAHPGSLHQSATHASAIPPSATHPSGTHSSVMQTSGSDPLGAGAGSGIGSHAAAIPSPTMRSVGPMALEMGKTRDTRDSRDFSGPERDVKSPGSVASNRSSGTPPLRRVDRSASGDLRAASKRDSGKTRPGAKGRRGDLELESAPSSSTYDPVHDKGKGTVRGMADIYEGYGDVPGSPLSPTRPQSVRRRQSMQQIKDLEARLDQLASENRLLAAAKVTAEKHLEDYHFSQSKEINAGSEALESRESQLREKDEEIGKLRETLDWVRAEVNRLTQVSEDLTATNATLVAGHELRYNALQEEHATVHDQWQSSIRDLEDVRLQHNELSTGMEELVRHEIDTALTQKNVELQQLHEELDLAKNKIRELQAQILSSRSTDVLVTRDEDYFDQACQLLCQHVQQWVLRFSKFSDMRACRLTREIRDEKVSDRLDSAILDGSDVDVYLADRIKRRDVFMSVVMNMVWEYVFTRYLFGMDREQRQKLKQLEKHLSEVGPPSAVHRWRATTLMLLSQRPNFQQQRDLDTEAVVQEIYHTLSKFLPPPTALEAQIVDSLRNVMRSAVNLSIEMRTQRAEYMMLPPLQPEYDTNGDLARKVYFNASLMNERSGETSSNEELEHSQAVVRMVLFPLVVKKGSDTGEGDEEIVVCPAQVLVAKTGKDKKVVRVLSGDRMSVDQASFAPSSMDMGNVI